MDFVWLKSTQICRANLYLTIAKTVGIMKLDPPMEKAVFILRLFPPP